MEMDINSLVKKVMDCGFRVHLALTPGYLEEVYKKAMMIELADAGLFSYVLKNKQTGLMPLCSFVLIFCSLWLTGCGDGSCNDNASAVPLARFYYSQGTTQVTVSDLTVSAIGAPGDTVLVDDDDVTDLHLPLRVGATSVQWCLSFAVNDTTSVTDTVTIAYRPKEYFASVECGAMYHFDITGVTHTDKVIDSVVVAQPQVTNVDQVNLRIYLPNN